jgi:predicted phage tail component-like protein
MQYEEIEIEGRGKLYRERFLDDINIEVEFNFISDKNKWNDTFRKAKSWINNFNENKLKFSDDLGYFYRVNKVEISTTERVYKKLGKFTVVFTCEPYMYLEDGTRAIELPMLLYNFYEKTQPIYIVEGEGFFSMQINRKTIKANVGQNLTIDTKLGLCYREDGTMQNTALIGNYEDMYLQNGENTFSYTSGFKVSIVPNWRCL